VKDLVQAIGPDARTRRDRILAAFTVILLHLGIGYLLLSAFGIDVVESTRSMLKVYDVTAELPPTEPPPIPAKAKVEEPTGAASAKNIKSKAAPKEAPTPKVKIKVKDPVPVAPTAGTGSDRSAGNSNQVGTGTGTGGQGDGTGAGGRGNGSGSAVASRAVYQSGRISNKDYPKSAAKAKVGGTVTAYFTVLPSGRAANCSIKKSSGNAELDATTCRLIEKRFRYTPARNRDGQAIEDQTGWQQTWWLETGGGVKVTE
jgi:periplasmic protein TonB